jgi:hypothetical protein
MGARAETALGTGGTVGGVMPQGLIERDIQHTGQQWRNRLCLGQENRRSSFDRDMIA